MRGITGIVDLRARRPIDRGVLQRMNERQHQRVLLIEGRPFAQRASSPVEANDAR